ncbi:MAG: tetratricopeptide repeat protein [Bacteroidales bacterium]
MKTKSWCMMAALVALSLLATTTRLSAQDWTGQGRIFGKVVDENGKPVANAVVKLRLKEAGETGPDAKTDKKGEFNAVSLRGGTWNIDVLAAGHPVQRLSVSLPAGEGRVPPIEIKLKKDEAGAQQKELQGLLAKGDELYKQEKFGEARAEYEKVLAARPDLVMVHRSIALTYGREHDYANALKELDLVLEKDPGDNALLQLAANSAIEMGDYQRAGQYLSRLDMSKVSDPGPLTNVAIAALNKNQPNFAVQVLDPLVDKFPQAPDPYYFRAMAELQMQQMDKAKADLQKFLPLAPPDSKEAQQAKQMLDQIKQSSHDSSIAMAAPEPAGPPVVVPMRASSAPGTRKPALQLRR